MTDQSLKHLVETELEWDPSLDAAGIGVAVDKSVVTLTGATGTYAQKLAAERIAMHVKGVKGVAQEIEVRPFGDVGVDDDEIAKRALGTLDWDVTVPTDRIKARVEAGVLTLSGEVDWNYQRDAAARAVRNIHGVLALENRIAVKPRVQPSDVHRRIEDALGRQAQIDASHVRVTVQGGQVSLEGKVHACSDRAIVERAARAAPGVSSVVDHLSVAA